jgi:hypothetical protein
MLFLQKTLMTIKKRAVFLQWLNKQLQKLDFCEIIWSIEFWIESNKQKIGLFCLFLPSFRECRALVDSFDV